VTPTSRWPVPSLLRSLARAGWGDLSGREWQGVRSVLRALCDSLPDRSGEGHVTEPQIAQRAGLSLRWTRRCLHVLEDLGIVASWRRGGIVNGRPTPSWLRLSKRALVALVEAARPLREAADAARRSETRQRVAGVLWAVRSRRSDRAALAAGLHSPTGGGSPPTSAGAVDNRPCGHGEPRGPAACALCRHGIAA